MDNKRLIKVIYWTHFAVAAASHIFVVLILGGAVTVVVGSTSLGFWIRGMLLGITFYSGMYATNHVTNKDGFCVLTDLENYYRKQENLPRVREFTPRFYKQCRVIVSSLYRFIWRRK